MFKSDGVDTTLFSAYFFFFWDIRHSIKQKKKKQTYPNIVAAAFKGSAKFQLLTMPVKTPVLVCSDKTTSASKFSHDCHIKGKQSESQSCQRHRITHFPTDAAWKCLSATLLRAVCSQLPNVMKASCLLVLSRRLNQRKRSYCLGVIGELVLHKPRSLNKKPALQLQRTVHFPA